MIYPKILQLLNENTTLRLLKATNAPLILAFLLETFNQLHKKETISERELDIMLTDYLYQIHEIAQKNIYPKKAKEYLLDWSSEGYLRRYPENESIFFELTPAAENALNWIEELEKPRFIGTESRLKYLINILKDLSVKSNTDAKIRIEELKKEKQRIDNELEMAKIGNFDKLDNRQIEEQYSLAEETARKLLSDFRQVEQNLRDLDKDFRKKIITSTESKGAILSKLWQEQDLLWATDQGQSFKAFWEFLLLQNQQTEFDKIIESILHIPIIQQIEKENEYFTIDSIKNNLINVGSKTNKTTSSLLEQLRKYLEHKTFYENKRVYEDINEIFELITQNTDKNWTSILPIEIAEVIKIKLTHYPLNLFKIPEVIKFTHTNLEKGTSNQSVDALYEQEDIDLKELNENIKNALKMHSQISLHDLIQLYEVKKGVAEVIGYISIANKHPKHICNADQTENVVVSNLLTSKMFSLTIPHIIFRQ